MVQRPDGWIPPVLACSAIEEWQLAEVWDKVLDHRRFLERDGALDRRRHTQDVAWMWATVDDQLRRRFHDAPAVRALASDLERRLSTGSITPSDAARALLALTSEPTAGPIDH